MCSFTAMKKGVGNVLAMLKGGGHKNIWGSFYPVA